MDGRLTQLPKRIALGALFAVGGLSVAVILWALWQNYVLPSKEAAHKERLRQELNEILRESLSRSYSADPRPDRPQV
jgi:hypothetical protein